MMLTYLINAGLMALTIGSAAEVIHTIASLMHNVSAIVGG